MRRLNWVLGLAATATLMASGPVLAQTNRQPGSQVLGNGISVSTGSASGGTVTRASMSATANRLQTSETRNRLRGYREYSNRFGDRGFLIEVARY